MIRSISESPLYPIVNPRSIAFFGASNTFMRMGSIMLSSLQALGFEGKIFPIHPTEKVVRGLAAYTTIMDVPEVPDLAIIVLPTEIVCQTLDDCGKKGIRHSIVVSGGFREAGPEGALLQKELEAIACRHGIRFLGPNCLGVANLHLKLNPTPIKADCPAGFVGLASQSGSFITQMFNYLHRHGMGFSTALSVGNEANIDIVDCLEYLGACPDTKVITLYIEGINRGNKFVEIAKAITPHKPIVALYVGGSETGKQAGLSHTGSLSGPNEIYDGIFKQCGIIRARTLTELFDYALALGTLPHPAGNRVVIQTHSGGPGATAADSCGRSGLSLPRLSPETVEKLKPLIPKTASTANPVDMTFSKNPAEDFFSIPDILLQDEQTDMLLAYFVSPGIFIERILGEMGIAEDLVALETDKLSVEYAEKFFSLTRLHPDKPIVGFTYRSLQEKMIRNLLDHGVPVYQDPERAVRAMAAVWNYYEQRERMKADAA
ncbi:MAG: CoA-binding protein [Deltaproteobacteria bacterium HGW-Deltaproteobacteria-1]|jgi:acyl-CoA synthetase (NDP forming)|nr:MAG: CoA-binding protein [Deltaproteobacteria bacterium HGW-Deltaproteobacteria-1]